MYWNNEYLFSLHGMLANKAICSVCINFIFNNCFETNYLRIYLAYFHQPPNGRYFIIDYRSDPLFPIGQGTLPWQPVLGQNSQKSLTHRCDILKELEFHNAYRCTNSSNDLATSYEHLVNFGSVIQRSHCLSVYLL